MFLHNNGSKLDFWKIASDDKNYMIEDTGNFMNMSDIKSNFISFLLYALFGRRATTSRGERPYNWHMTWSVVRNAFSVFFRNVLDASPFDYDFAITVYDY